LRFAEVLFHFRQKIFNNAWITSDRQHNYRLETINRDLNLKFAKVQILDTPPKLKETLEGDVVVVRTNKVDELSQLVTKWLGFNNEKIVDGALEITVRNGKTVMPRIMELATQNNIYVESLLLREPNLEDVFLHYTGRNIREDTTKELHGAAAARRRAIR
jgi:ABC-2 type transport system ATP-binding protein